MNIRQHPEVTAFKIAAEQFCTLFECAPGQIDLWIAAVLSALAGAYAAAHRLPDLGLDDGDLSPPDSFDVVDEEWRSVFSLVAGILKQQDGYWGYFDPSEPPESGNEPVFHSLSDDLADIYRDLKPGLRGWESDGRYLPTIVFRWMCAFENHWGVHAVSAMRALHPIVFLRGLRREETS